MHIDCFNKCAFFSSRGKPLCLACVEEAPHRFCDAIALKSDSSTVILHFFLLAISLSSVRGFAPFLLHLFSLMIAKVFY